MFKVVRVTREGEQTLCSGFVTYSAALFWATDHPDYLICDLQVRRI